MSSVVIIVECVSYRKTSIPCVVLYEEKRWHEGTIYSSPGGYKDKGETYLEAAIRETREEAFLEIPKEKMGNPIKVGKVYFWVVKLPRVSREEFIKARFCVEGLKSSQKETYDLTKVPLMNLKKAIRERYRYVTDLGGRKLKLRKAFYDCLIADERIIKKIESVFKRGHCAL